MGYSLFVSELSLSLISAASIVEGCTIMPSASNDASILFSSMLFSLLGMTV